MIGANRTVEIGGVELVGASAENGAKLLISLALIALVIVLSRVLRIVLARLLKEHHEQVRFWARQALRLFTVSPSGGRARPGAGSVGFDE